MSGDLHSEAYTGSVWAVRLSLETRKSGEPTVSSGRKATPEGRVVGLDGPLGVYGRGTHAEATQEPGRPARLLDGTRYRVGPAETRTGLTELIASPGGLCRSEEDLGTGYRESTAMETPETDEQESESLVVPMKPGNPPEGTRWREGWDREQRTA